jgi:sugar diacid utilization regulator
MIGPLITQAIVSNTQYQNNRGRYYEYFMNDILSGKLTNQEQIEKQMKLLHYSPDSRYCVILIELEKETALSLERLLSYIERFRGCKPVLYQKKIAAILPLTDTDTSSFIMESLKELSLKLHFRVGISDIFQGFEPIPTCYKQAEYALQLTTIQTYDSVLLYNNCALNHLQQGLESSTCKCFYPIGLDILKQYDQKNHTALLFTLKIYLENERNVIKTAELLFIHRNTLSYRIKKIQDLCRFNLENSKLRLRLLFSLQEISS